MDETSGTTAIDGSGFNHPGTLVNGATRVAGKYGQAVSLNGSNQYINIADHNDYTLNPSQSYTWSAWVKNNNFNQWSTVWSQTVSSSNFFISMHIHQMIMKQDRLPMGYLCIGIVTETIRLL